jgi:hypothetical protein
MNRRLAAGSGAVEVGLGGDQSMKIIFGNWPLHPKQADYYDLIVKGYRTLGQLQLGDLDRWCQLNVELLECLHGKRLMVTQLKLCRRGLVCDVD